VEKEYSLTALTATDQFKTYEQLETRLKMVLGQKSSRPRLDEEVEDETMIVVLMLLTSLHVH
jgi:hypothetical protein